jgi:hypothetical protein
MKVSAISAQTKTSAPSNCSVGPNATAQPALSSPVKQFDQRIAHADRRAAGAAAAAEHEPGQQGMFSIARDDVAAGRAARARLRQVSVSPGAISSPRSSAHCAAQSRSIMIGSRWITTLRKLPTAGRSARSTAAAGRTGAAGQG